MTPNPRNIFRPSPGERRVVYRDGDTADIIRVIMLADKDSGRFVIKGNVPLLKGRNDRETLENIWHFVKGKVNYKADRPGHEIVRSPAYLFETAIGDCKSLSVAIGALCRAMGIPYRYRFIAQSGKRNLHHVYVVAMTAAGEDVLLDAVHRSFDSEPTHSRRVDLRPGQRVPAGLHGSSDFWKDTLTLVGIVIIGGWILKKMGK